MVEKSPVLSETPEGKLTYQFATLALYFLAIVTVFGKAYEHLLKAIDSSIYAGLSMSVTAQGLVPHLPIGLESDGGFYGTRGFNDHPALLLYVSGWVMRALGPEAWTARLVPCLLSAGCVPVLFALGKKWGTPFRGWIAGGVLALTVSFFRNASGFQLDGPMTVFILLSFLAWEKRWPLRTGIFAGLAILVKAPVGLLVFPVALLAEWILVGNPRAILRDWFLALGVCLGMVVGFWAIYYAIGGASIVSDYWGRYVFGTLQGRDGSQSFDPFLFFKEISRLYWPWMIAFGIGIYSIGRRRVWRTRGELIPLLALVFVVVIVSMIKFKSGAHYFLPAYPFMAWVAAKPISEWLERRELRFLRGASMVVFFATLVLVCFPISLTPEHFPGLRKFNALIQSEGTVQDRVLFVHGGYPYGSFMDYAPEINFYTGRQVDWRNCEEVGSALDGDERIRWIIVAGENNERCLTPKARALFPTVYRSGKVYLLSKQARAPEIDLTPLEREGKAVIDGRAAPMPRDRYR